MSGLEGGEALQTEKTTRIRALSGPRTSYRALKWLDGQKSPESEGRPCAEFLGSACSYFHVQRSPLGTWL